MFPSSASKMSITILLFVLGLEVSSSQCPLQSNSIDGGQPVPTLNPIYVGDPYITGKVLASDGKGANGTVQVCVNDAGAGGAQAVSSDGYFSATPSGVLKADDKITVQFKAAGSNPSAIRLATVTAPATTKPVPPTLSAKITAGTTKLRGHAQPVDAQFPTAASIYICVWATQPAPNAADCRSGSTKPATLVPPSGENGKVQNGKVQEDKAGNWTVQAEEDGYFVAQLSTQLKAGQYVSAVENLTIGGDIAQDVLSKASVGVAASNQCNHNYATEPYSDCDSSLSLIGGVEESAQSSSQTATSPFIRVFTRAQPWANRPMYLWAYIRLLGAPTTSSTNGVVSVVSNPSGSLTTQTFSSIGTSIDFMIGGEYEFVGKKGLSNSPYTLSFIFGFGGTTPLQANTLALAYTAPPYGSVECPDLYTRFQNQFIADNIILGSAANTTFPTPTPTNPTPSCLVNKNSPTTTNSVTTYAPVTTIGFSNQDRTSFLGKDMIGIRTIDRFLGSGDTACGDTDTVNHVGHCERGIVDFMVGQDASITGGQMRKYIFKVDAVHPLPVASVNILYLFGSASIRLAHNTNYPPLVLQSANIATLTGTGSSSVPNLSTVVLSLVQPNRDYYRFGIGINVLQIFSKLSPTSTGNSSGSTNP